MNKDRRRPTKVEEETKSLSSTTLVKSAEHNGRKSFYLVFTEEKAFPDHSAHRADGKYQKVGMRTNKQTKTKIKLRYRGTLRLTCRTYKESTRRCNPGTTGSGTPML